MGMQYDVLAAHLNASGVAYLGRTRLKGLLTVGSTSAGTVNIWDSTVAAKSGTYSRTGNVVTVTVTTHGLSNGQAFGFAASTGNASSGNFTVASVANANAFTFTDIFNSGSTTGNCGVNTRFLMAFGTANNSAETYLLLPGEGILAQNGIVIGMNNQTSMTVFYG
jgi:hypothetical protein|tara:strand:- start:568 stop:1062 length:495 start_codon:yes stop_codon:yes gene_type:complete